MDPPTNLYEFPSSCDPTDSYQNTTDLHSMEFIRIPILNHTDLHTNPHTDLATVRRSRSLPISLYRSRCAVCWSRRYGRSQWTDRIEGMPESVRVRVYQSVCVLMDAAVPHRAHTARKHSESAECRACIVLYDSYTKRVPCVCARIAVLRTSSDATPRSI